jgi:hypothetical protein
MSAGAETTDHGTIKKWAESRGEHPALVKRTGGLWRIDFGEPEENLERRNWEDFFAKFDESHIKFLYSP